MNRTQAQARHEHLAQAQVALTHYPIGPATLAFQSDSENTTFRVHAREDGTRFLLRRHKTEAQVSRSETELRSEMNWLAAIRARTDIIAPGPVANIGGDWVTSIGGTRWTLTTWIEGRFLNDRHSPSRAFRAGETLARLHRQGEAWTRPEGFERPCYDTQTLREHLKTYHEAATRGLLTANDLVALEAVMDRVAAAMDAIGKAPSDFGLIHGDFHNRNYLFRRGRVHPIDFSLCGDGFYLADLGYALCGLWHRGVGLAGYQSVRPLPSPHLPLIETFMVFGILGETAFHMRQGWSQGKSSDHPTWLIDSLRDKYLRGQKFLTDW